MLYNDGTEARLGDEITISGKCHGTVVACMDRAEYSSAYPEAEWAYLKVGVLVDTDFAGLVHYPDSAQEHFALVKRNARV